MPDRENEPLYSLSVHFDDLTDEGARDMIIWLATSPETAHLTYWISKTEQDEPEEVSGDG